MNMPPCNISQRCKIVKLRLKSLILRQNLLCLTDTSSAFVRLATIAFDSNSYLQLSTSASQAYIERIFSLNSLLSA